MSYPIRDPSMTLREITTLVERETQIAVARQDLLLSSGLEPHQGKPAQQCIVGDQVSSGQCIVGDQVSSALWVIRWAVHCGWSAAWHCRALGNYFQLSCTFIDNNVGRSRLHFILAYSTKQNRCNKIGFQIKYSKSFVWHRYFAHSNDLLDGMVVTWAESWYSCQWQHEWQSYQLLTWATACQLSPMATDGIVVTHVDSRYRCQPMSTTGIVVIHDSVTNINFGHYLYYNSP